MTAVEVCNHIVESKSCHLVRVDLTNRLRYNIKLWTGKGNKRGWIYLDIFTASVVQTIYNSLSEQNKEKFNTFPLEKAITISFNLYNKVKKG